MHAPSDWKIGKHTFHLEPPNLLWVTLAGDNSLEEALEMIDLYQRLGEARPLYFLVDSRDAGELKPEARHCLSERMRHEWLLDVIFFNTRLLHRAMAQGLILAAELFRVRESPMRGRLHFVSTRVQAEALLAQLRERRGDVARAA